MPKLSGGPSDCAAFLDDIQKIVASSAEPAFVDRNPDVLERFTGYDDVWWTTKMREAAANAPGDPWINLACYRRPGPVSLWKRVLDFPGDLQSWNEGLPGANDDMCNRAWKAAQDELERDGVLVVRHYFRPWEPLDARDPSSESALSIWDPRRVEQVPLTKVSSIVKNLDQAWRADLQVHAFASDGDGLSAQETIERLPTVNAGEGGTHAVYD